MILLELFNMKCRSIIIASLTTSLITSFAAAKDLTVGVENIEYYPIYSIQNGKYVGAAQEILDAFATKYNHNITYKPLPVKRLFNEFVEEKVDLKFPDNAYWAQDLKKGKDVKYSASTIEYIDGVMVLPKNKAKGGLKKLGTMRGFTPWEFLGDIKAGRVQTNEQIKLDSLMKLVSSGRIDGVYFNTKVSEYYLKHSDFDNNLVVFDESLPHTRSAYHLSSIKHGDIIKQFDEFLEQEAAMIDEIKTKYEIKLN